LLQEAGSEENDIQHWINQMIHLEQTWEEVFQITSKIHERIKRIYDRKTRNMISKSEMWYFVGMPETKTRVSMAN